MFCFQLLKCFVSCSGLVPNEVQSLSASRQRGWTKIEMLQFPLSYTRWIDSTSAGALLVDCSYDEYGKQLQVVSKQLGLPLLFLPLTICLRGHQFG